MLGVGRELHQTGLAELFLVQPVGNTVPCGRTGSCNRHFRAEIELMQVDIVVRLDERYIPPVRRDNGIPHRLVAQRFARILLRVHDHIIRIERTAIDLLFVGVFEAVTLLGQIAQDTVLFMRAERRRIILSVQDVVHHIRTRRCKRCCNRCNKYKSNNDSIH